MIGKLWNEMNPDEKEVFFNKMNEIYVQYFLIRNIYKCTRKLKKNINRN
jgi:hypothetical protein